MRLKKMAGSSKSIKKATLITAISKYSIVVMNLLFNAILSRLLTPDDYGIVAILTVFTNFFVLFSDMGMGAAVIQNKDLSKEDENRIFSFSIGLGIALAIIFSLFSILLVQIYNNTVYYILGPLLSISLMFNTFNMVPNAILLKEKKFLLAGIRNIASNIFCYMIAILIALLGGNYYAIVLQSIFSSLTLFLWNLKSSSLKMQFKNMGVSIKKIWNFSLFQFLFSLINYFTRNLDNLFVGYFFGQKKLGYYDKAYRLMRYPVENLTNTLTPSLQPILSDYQDDNAYILKKYNQIAKLLFLVGVYVAVLCFYAPREIVLLFFGRQWENAVLCFQILSLPIVLQLVNGLGGSIYQSLNKTKYLFINGIISAVILVLSIIVGIILGSIESLAFSYSIGFCITFFVCEWCLAKFCFHTSVFNLLKVFIREFLIFVILFVAMYFVPSFESLILSFVLKFTICTIIYVIMLILTKEYRVYMDLTPQKIKDKFKKHKI